jgi:hypothetical protein
MNICYAENNDLAAVDRLNRRLKAGGRDVEMPLDIALPGEAKYKPEGFPLYRRMIIAKDGPEVRAAMLMCHHTVFIHGVRREFCWTKMPLSEGTIDIKYSPAIVRLIKKALDYQPFMMGVGLGPLESEGGRFFSRLKWRSQPIPFFFLPVNVSKVLRDLPYLKKNATLRCASVLGAYSGLGAGISGWFAFLRRIGASLSSYEDSVVESFGAWADYIFYGSLSDYPVAIRSDAAALNIVYPPGDHRYIRIKVRRKSARRDAGWIIVARKRMSGHHYFGDLTVGTLVDGFGRSEDTPALVAAGLRRLAHLGVDIIVANFSHAAWAQACLSSGMFEWASQFHLFVSPEGAPLLEKSCPLHQIHIARGHSDGMEHLI